jgi:hypothetical protein
MNIQEYYDIIIDKYKSGSFKLREGKHMESNPEIKEKEYPLHALNYLIYEYLKDNKDDRWKLLLDYVLVPNGVNKGNCDIDFTQIDFEEFFYFMVSIKS